MKNDQTIYKFLRLVAITGNGIFVLWILYNGIDEGFQGNIYQIVSYLGLIFLLILNALLLLSGKTKK